MMFYGDGAEWRVLDKTIGKRCWLLCVDRGLWYKVLAICMGSTRGRLGEAVSRRRYGGGSWVILGRVLLLYEGRRAGLFNVWGIVAFDSDSKSLTPPLYFTPSPLPFTFTFTLLDSISSPGLLIYARVSLPTSFDQFIMTHILSQKNLYFFYYLL
ncbi:4F5 family protein [Medicago truncatula]|uniref:4F5 family protein n=1 Tax=Medicago truncatula TaxID=3880 RepID=G7LFV5_MEDTR|nr:4F5 family protein [Medicago truncatula]